MARYIKLRTGIARRNISRLIVTCSIAAGFIVCLATPVEASIQLGPELPPTVEMIVPSLDLRPVFEDRPALVFASPVRKIPEVQKQHIHTRTSTYSRQVRRQSSIRHGSSQCMNWMSQAGITDTQNALFLIQKESGCNPNAVNKSSGACGLPQSLPCSKMGPVNPDGTSAVSPVGQLRWMQRYVFSRYGSWAKAVAFWQRNRWY